MVCQLHQSQNQYLKAQRVSVAVPVRHPYPNALYMETPYVDEEKEIRRFELHGFTKVSTKSKGPSLFFPGTVTGSVCFKVLEESKLEK